MARVNIGVNPFYLSDQHLIAESVEITMITGTLRVNNYLIKSPVHEQFAMGKGHMNFFKTKLLYLNQRLFEVNHELRKRSIKASTTIDLTQFPESLVNNYVPTLEDSLIVRNRIYERLLHPLKAKPGFHRYRKEKIKDMELLAIEMLNSPLYYV